jgi:hypothetical protein
VLALETGLDGMIYAGGAFTTLGGIAASKIGRWNGANWQAMGTGANALVYTLKADPKGKLYIGGAFSMLGGAAANKVGVWNGSMYTVLPVTFPGSAPNLYTAAFDALGDAYFFYDTTGTASAGSITSVTNPGTATVAPRFVITGPGVVNALKNLTTGDTINFNLTLQASEIATLDLTPGAIKFTSNWRGNLMGTILPGSNFATFKLLPGANSLSVYISSGATAATAVRVEMPLTYYAFDGVSV